MARLSFVLVDSKYCDYLREEDPCVPYTMDEKSKRPFVGILLQIDTIPYYAPLSSPKRKHKTMKNQIDLLKIMDGEYGVINFNNMIPVHPNSITDIDLATYPTDSASETKYKELLINQLTWCNAHRTEIISKAQKLYSLITGGGGWKSLTERCCNFIIDEKKLLCYCTDRGWTM